MGKKHILEEEVYLERLKRVIESHFFPQLKKYHLEEAYFDACRSKDTASILLLTQQLYDFENAELQTSNHQDGCSSKSSLPKITRLEEFAETFSSQDNTSFHAILDQEALKRKSWMEQHFTKRTLDNTPMLKYTISDPSTAMFGIPENKTLPVSSIQPHLLLPSYTDLSTREITSTTSYIGIASSGSTREDSSPSVSVRYPSNINFDNTRFDTFLVPTITNPVSYTQISSLELPLVNPIKFDPDFRKRKFIEESPYSRTRQFHIPPTPNRELLAQSIQLKQKNMTKLQPSTFKRTDLKTFSSQNVPPEELLKTPALRQAGKLFTKRYSWEML